jgi:hypothetical protein
MSNTVYRKTERGALAFKERASFLTPQLRSLLIMIDGVKSTADLMKFGGVMGDVAGNLERLATDGLIEPIGAALASLEPLPPSPAAAVPASFAAPATAPVLSMPLPTFIRQATRVLVDGMGPMADPICERLEKCKTVAEAQPVAMRALEMLTEARRSEAADKLRNLLIQLR